MTIKSINGKENGKYPEFDDHTLDGFHIVVVDRIKQLAPTGNLLCKDLFPKILLSWKTWGDAAEADAYVASLISNTNSFIRFLDKFIYQSTSVGGGDKVARVKNKLGVSGIAAVTDIKAVIQRVEALDDRDLSEHEKEIVKIARESLEEIPEKWGLPPTNLQRDPISIKRRDSTMSIFWRAA